MKIDTQIQFWAHMLDESFCKDKMLTEGKHWPEDYEKTAYNAIKSSTLGQQSWYTDNYIKQDVSTFIDEFTPLSHKNSNLGFFMAVIRWFIEYSGDSQQRYQEFIERKLGKIIMILLKIRADTAYDAKADEIKKMSFSQFEKLADEVNAKTSDNDIAASSGAKYNVVPIYSYEELNKRYGGNLTGWHGDSEWCHTNGKSTYNSWTKDGTQMFFVIEQEGWQSVKVPDVKPDTCYDEYGMSLIAILVDVKTNKLLNSTSRWNHIVLPASGAADTMFESWSQLNKAVGIDVENICKRECAGLAKKLKTEQDKVDNAVNEILNSGITSIENDTIPEKFRKLVTKIVIPSNVASISNDAFLGYTSLIHVTIPNSVTSIGGYAFDGCRSLTSVIIPDSVTSIGSYAFYSCRSLTSVTIPPGVTSIEEYTFDDCSGLMSVTIPNSVTSIGRSAFSGCIGLISVTIGNSVTSIGNWAFYYCTSLTSVIIPNNVTSMGCSAFRNCSSLMSVTIPDSVTNIGDFAFYGCNSLTHITFKGKTLDQVKAMDKYPWGIKDTSIIKCENVNKNTVAESFSTRSNNERRKTMKKIAKTKYTKKQIQESIRYWQKQLKLGNYKKLNEAAENYDTFKLYGEMNIQGSYNGLEHWWLVVSDNTDITVKTYEDAAKEIISNFTSEYEYAFIDPKTNKVVDYYGLNFQYLANQLLKNGKVSMSCSDFYEPSEFDLSAISKADCRHGIVELHYPTADDIEYCINTDAVTNI